MIRKAASCRYHNIGEADNKKEGEVKTDELSLTPPVPWTQYNEWPVCCDKLNIILQNY